MDVPKTDLVGVFLDSPVSGVSYETETKSGKTDENGNFEYDEGEIITFSVGNIILGSAVASDTLTPMSLALSGSELSNPEVQNIAAFLQTLDSDGNVENGITITEEVVNAISVSEIDFSTNIIEILSEIVLEVFIATGIDLQLVFPDKATEHLAGTLKLDFEAVPTFSGNFLPTFTSYFSTARSDYFRSATNNLKWVHEFTDGFPSKSISYEKYPFRILSEYTYSNYDEITGTVDLQINTTNYHDWKVYPTENYKIKFDENYFLTEFIPGEGAELSRRKVFNELDENGRIISSSIINADGKKTLDIRNEYAQSGAKTNLKTFSADGTLSIDRTFSYNDFGDLQSIMEKNTAGERQYTFYYSSNNSLSSYEYQFSSGTTIYNFSNEEYLTNVITDYDNGEQVIYEYGPEEKLEKYYWDGMITDIYYYHFTESDYLTSAYRWDWFDEGILRERHILNDNFEYESFEYFYDNGNPEYKDIYDDSGNKIYTEKYDQDGNLTETICYHNDVEVSCN